MNATINNTLAADARKALEAVKAVHARSKAEVDAGRFVWRGPSVCPKEGDGVSEKVPSDKALRAEEDRVNARLFDLLDDVVHHHTGFGGSFSDLVLAQENNGYRPTFRESCNEALAVLADAYDLCAAARGLESSYRPERDVPKVELIAAAKRLAKADGITGRKGGWLYKGGKPLCQGWLQLACRYVRSGRLTDVEYRGERRFCRVVS